MFTHFEAEQTRNDEILDANIAAVLELLPDYDVELVGIVAGRNYEKFVQPDAKPQELKDIVIKTKVF